MGRGRLFGKIGINLNLVTYELFSIPIFLGPLALELKLISQGVFCPGALRKYEEIEIEDV